LIFKIRNTNYNDNVQTDIREKRINLKR